MKTKHLIITLLACCLFTISCKDEEKDSVVPETEKPSEDTPAVKPGAKIGEVNAVQGTVYYNESLRLWFIYVIEKGTIDCTECYFPTNISDDFKIDGLRVIFSGTVYEVDEALMANISQVVSAEYYVLTLSSIEIDK